MAKMNRRKVNVCVYIIKNVSSIKSDYKVRKRSFLKTLERNMFFYQRNQASTDFSLPF